MGTEAVMMMLASLVIGLTLGAVTTWLVLSARLREQSLVPQERALESRAQLDQARVDVAEARAQAAAAQAEAAEVYAQLASARTQARAATEAAEAERRRGEQLAQDYATQSSRFQAVAAELLEKQGRQVDERAAARLTETERLLAPIAEALARFQERLTQVEKDRSSMSAALNTQMRQVAEASMALRQETQALANALRKPQVRGAWGETQLRTIVEAAGMLPYCDFTEQYSATAANGAMQRPDMKVNLGEGRTIFVDSKVPLAAFLDALDARDDNQRASLEAAYARQVRAHVDKLGKKTYWDLATEPHPEQVVMFLPGEGFLLAALDHEPGLYQYAIERGVLIATPNTLLAMLHTVAHTWRQAEMAADARKVLDASAELYRRLGTMNEHVTRLGKALGSSVDAYNKFVGSMESRVLPKARELHAMKVGSTEIAATGELQALPRTPQPSDM